MFIKPFRIKSQTQLKGSDRKKLRTELRQAFPSLSEAEVSQLLPNKEEVTLIRMYCHRGESVIVYQVQKDPLFFALDKERQIYPTVYLLWRHPNLLHTFTTHPPVVQVLGGGADLMLPGIVTKGEMTPKSYGRFEKGHLVAVNTTENGAPIAVGVTAHSSMDMFMAGRQGRGVCVMHVYCDQLWEMGSKVQPPSLPPPEVARQDQENNCSPAVEMSGNQSPDAKVDEGQETIEVMKEMERLDFTGEEKEGGGGDGNNFKESSEAATPQEEEQPQLTGPESMDRLLLHCFLKAWKTSAKKVEVPILTSNFYRIHMLPACPDGATLDIKKSSYKKLSKFLNAMAKKELIEVKEFPKGIENITGINWAHEDLKAFVVDMDETTVAAPRTGGGGSPAFVPPKLEEVHQVSGDTLHFFKANGFSKGDVLTIGEVRTVVTNYIKNQKLKQEGKNTVTLNPVLHEAVVNRKEGYREVLRWDEIFSRMLGKMAPAVRITRSGAIPIIRKGKLDPIDLAVAKRSGNKKVTLIYNAGVYGIDESELAHQIQVGVAASTSVGPAEHKPAGTTQVLVQGNQVAFIAKLLLETYHIPRKYIRGLELAPKGKK
ncbi:hypothetical protein Pcinc_042143 [Petrolisthes cinctipes]|uniref:SUI1 domain-containing protein n=1 Tax=Petrolisthes cinctipes TaxID=88211 RepID=A0AAE1BI20_PETCI|nr:hypothetical protein Pcinc_042143 [Petrolisthes cinctipes]